MMYFEWFKWSDLAISSSDFVMHNSGLGKISSLLQAILDGACISLPHGSLNECYDELGTRYTIPVYCLSYPINIVVDSASSGRPDSPAEFSVPVNGEVGILMNDR